MGALLQLASRVIAPLARRLGGTSVARLATGAGVIGAGTLAGNVLFDALDGDGGRVSGGMPRRRRRRALTNDDMKTALTIASAISKKAAENFVLMRVRGS